MTSAEVASLKEYIELRFKDLEKLLCSQRDDIVRRVNVLEEFKKEAREDVAALREFKASMDAKASQGSVIFVGVISVIGVIASVVGLIHALFP